MAGNWQTKAKINIDKLKCNRLIKSIADCGCTSFDIATYKDAEHSFVVLLGYLVPRHISGNWGIKASLQCLISQKSPTHIRVTTFEVL